MLGYQPSTVEIDHIETQEKYISSRECVIIDTRDRALQVDQVRGGCDRGVTK